MRVFVAVMVGFLVTTGISAQETIDVPLRIEGGRLHVPVHTPSGEVLDFMVSTGNGATMLSESTTARMQGLGHLLLGSHPVSTEESHTIPDRSLVSEGFSYDGIIGANTLNQFDVLLDVPGGRLVLQPVGPPPTWPGVDLSDPIRIRVFHGMAINMDVEIDGKPFGASLDLGRPVLAMNPAAAAALGKPGGGSISVRIGQKTLTGLSSTVSESEVFERWDPSDSGFVILGAESVATCALSISYVHTQLRTCVQ